MVYVVWESVDAMVVCTVVTGVCVCVCVQGEGWTCCLEDKKKISSLASIPQWHNQLTNERGWTPSYLHGYEDLIRSEPTFRGPMRWQQNPQQTRSLQPPNVPETCWLLVWSEGGVAGPVCFLQERELCQTPTREDQLLLPCSVDMIGCSFWSGHCC